jgi:hypothetical protein
MPELQGNSSRASCRATQAGQVAGQLKQGKLQGNSSRASYSCLSCPAAKQLPCFQATQACRAALPCFMQGSFALLELPCMKQGNCFATHMPGLPGQLQQTATAATDCNRMPGLPRQLQQTATECYSATAGVLQLLCYSYGSIKA